MINLSLTATGWREEDAVVTEVAELMCTMESPVGGHIWIEMLESTVAEALEYWRALT